MANHLPVVRSASLNGYFELARTLQLDARAHLRRVGLQRLRESNPKALPK